MVRGKHGVTVTHQQSWADFGVEEIAYEIRWVTEPGWLTLQAELPTLCTVATELGGRCELRARPDQPTEGEYFGSDALTIAAPGASVAIYAAEMWQARLCCFALHASEADYLSQEQIAAIGLLPSRYMFRNDRGRACAALLDTDRMRAGASATYVLSLSKALFAAVLDMTHELQEQSKPAALTGSRWDAVTMYLRDHLNEPISVATLAPIARMPPEQFGAAFRAATGMSVRQWQMDHRVRAAQRLLADNPRESLAEVATLCGFQDQSHFSRAFLKVVGQTPTAWLHSRT
jgi:AraC family transcriptional regulator